MFFLRQKKQKRDREAGLVFQWRGAKHHHLGKFIALMVAGSFFAFGAYAIRIEGPESPLVSKRTGSVILLSEDDPYCKHLLFQIEEKSPFPIRWDPIDDPGTLTRISAKVDAVINQPWNYYPELKPIPEISQDTSKLASILNSNAGIMMDVMREWPQNLDNSIEFTVGDVFVSARVRSSEAIAKRIVHQEWILPVNLVTEDWYGQSFRFMVGIDKDGVIRHCLPISGASMGVLRIDGRQKDMGVWLRLQRFKPSNEQEMTMGEVEIQIDALRE